MNKFQYFIPGAPTATAQLLSDRGLCSLVKSNASGDSRIAKLISLVTKTSGRGARNGPGGIDGVIVGEEITGYHPDRQTWIPAPQGDAEQPPYWVGFTNDAKPTNIDLQRDELLPSKPVRFRDGTEWQVPTLQQWHESTNIPAVWTSPLPLMVDIDRYGQAIDGPIVPEYRDLFDVGMKILARMAGGKDDDASPITNAIYLQFAADVLGCNYHVSLLELSSSVLDCLSTTDAINIVHSAIDWEGYMAALGNWAGRQGRPDTNTDAGSAA